MSSHHYLRFAVATVLFAASVGCAADPAADRTASAGQTMTRPATTKTQVLELSRLQDGDWLVERLAERRVIFVGESHDRYEDHLEQLAIIEGLRARGKSLAIGLEFFQQPFQQDLDAYVAGTIGEPEFLRRTQYFERWRFDYRLYRPILRYAREQRIPLVALNLESELTRKVGEAGIAGLDADERARIPAEIDRSDTAYRTRIEGVFRQHPPEMQSDFAHFLEVQLLWDEGMAERAARYLTAHPERTLVVLAGGGHIEYGQGIPRRLLRRLPVSAATVLNGRGRDPAPGVADFFVYPSPVELPPAGMLGIMLDESPGGGGMLVKGFAEQSGAKDAGIREGDRIVRIGDQPVANYGDIRIALLDGAPGQGCTVEVVRAGGKGEEHLTFAVVLH